MVWPARERCMEVCCCFIMVQYFTMCPLARLFVLLVPFFVSALAFPATTTPPPAAPLALALALAFALALALALASFLALGIIAE